MHIITEIRGLLVALVGMIILVAVMIYLVTGDIQPAQKFLNCALDPVILPVEYFLKC